MFSFFRGFGGFKSRYMLAWVLFPELGALSSCFLGPDACLLCTLPDIVSAGRQSAVPGCMDTRPHAFEHPNHAGAMRLSQRSAGWLIEPLVSRQGPVARQNGKDHSL